jgi:hypothetical protein
MLDNGLKNPRVEKGIPNICGAALNYYLILGPP